MQIQRVLERLGYNHNEVTVYLAMMQLGDTTVTEIARKTQLPRSTAQLAANALQVKGLATLSPRRNHPVWSAENPSKFLLDLREKEALLKRLLPEMLALRHAAKKKSILKLFNGFDKIKGIFEAVLQSSYPIFVLGSVEHMSHYLGQEEIEDFFEKLFSRTVPVQLLSTSSEFVLKLKKQSESGQNRVRLFTDEHLTQVTYIFFDTHVAIILLSAQESTGIIFEDTGMVESTKTFFQRLWDDSSSVVTTIMLPLSFPLSLFSHFTLLTIA